MLWRERTAAAEDWGEVRLSKVSAVNRAGSPEQPCQSASQSPAEAEAWGGGEGLADQRGAQPASQANDTNENGERRPERFVLYNHSLFLLPWLRAKIYLYLLPAHETQYQRPQTQRHTVKVSGLKNLKEVQR